VELGYHMELPGKTLAIVLLSIRQLCIFQSSKTPPMPKYGRGAGLGLRVTLGL
jgi:hypothetical protein